MSYTKPQDVVAPRDKWSLIEVLHDGGADEWSAAKGTWYGEDVLAIRWNGSEGGLGHPSAFAQPVWFILPNKLAPIVEAALGLMTDGGQKTS